MKKNKHIIFDLDGTLTRSRSVITSEMSEALGKIGGLYDVVVISGAQRSQMIKQIPWLGDSSFTIMSQSGNDTRKELSNLWKNHLTFEDVHNILYHAQNYLDFIGNDIIELRGGQVSISMLGHNAPQKTKRYYDSEGIKRRAILSRFPFESDTLFVRIGGTTCFDYTKKTWGKKGNIERLFKFNGWDLKEAVYIGDQLYEGGNDEDVMEIMDVVSVENPDDVLEFINQELL